MPSGLDRYRAKRRFDETPEPKGGVAADGELIFVVQKHHARRMHYDLRLQMGGTLKSWAVPEGPCLDPKVRRFAKLVEDHPLDYATFEGRIPEGNYGAGAVIVWDRGTWVTLAEPEEALAAGEIKFRLAGEKLGGGWMLKRLPDDPTNWLLIKERDPSARPLADFDVLQEQPNSVVTGRPVTTLLGCSCNTSKSASGRADGSRSLISSQLVGSSGRRFSIQPPPSFSPASRNLISPAASASSGSARVTQVPRSHTITAPAP